MREVGRKSRLLNTCYGPPLVSSLIVVLILGFGHHLLSLRGVRDRRSSIISLDSKKDWDHPPPGGGN